MSETPKEDSTNLYDKIREEMREKQRVEAERKQRTEEMFNEPKNDLLDRFKGENK
jgi:hypothetical protein